MTIRVADDEGATHSTCIAIGQDICWASAIIVREISRDEGGLELDG
jgi:hypothetical protein